MTTTAELSLNLFESMVRIRMIEEAIAEKYTEQPQKMRCPVHLSIGQEAAAAGVGLALQTDDMTMSGHRSHAHYLARGGDLNSMIAELHGRETGCCKGRGGSMHLVDMEVGFMGAVPIVGSTIPIAVGLGFAEHLKKGDRVSVAFFGEGATEEGVFHESMNFASLHKLPVVFVCENNLYSVYSPMEVRQPAHREVFQQAAGHGVVGHQGDGNNPIEVYDLMTEALSHARDRKGPVFLELNTYRWREHCGPNYDNDIGYRTEEEFLEWKRKDPIARFKEIIEEHGVFDETRHSRFVSDLDAEINEAFAAAAAAPFPSPESLLDNVYA